MDKGWTPPTLHDLAGVPFQEADSRYQILLIMGCRPIPVFPLFCQLQAKSCTPPTLHDLERASQMDKGWTPRLSNGQGFDPPNPSRLVPNGQGFDPPQPFTTWSGSANGQGFEPPTLHDFGAAPKWTRVWPPQPFTTWRGSQMDKGLTPNPSRLGVAPKWTRVGPPPIGLDPPTLHDLAGVPFQEADSFCYQILLI